ncbi:hypothetical protein MCOR07_010139 [Pyricularia oryzae]|nr:hypothetical protein MCOR16_009009 [Pyricularia oryzae]KAI6611733.1 hypothetical protein MCOR07_010139 [Pyricularia oryzae]
MQATPSKSPPDQGSSGATPSKAALDPDTGSEPFWPGLKSRPPGKQNKARKCQCPNTSAAATPDLDLNKTKTDRQLFPPAWVETLRCDRIWCACTQMAPDDGIPRQGSACAVCYVLCGSDGGLASSWLDLARSPVLKAWARTDIIDMAY